MTEQNINQMDAKQLKMVEDAFQFNDGVKIEKYREVIMDMFSVSEDSFVALKTILSMLALSELPIQEVKSKGVNATATDKKMVGEMHLINMEVEARITQAMVDVWNFVKKEKISDARKEINIQNEEKAKKEITKEQVKKETEESQRKFGKKL